MDHKPVDVGIIAMEIIIPSLYVHQKDLEEFDNVSAGKYTIGLGQSKMGFCSDREDINSLCLTAVCNLMEKYKVDYKNIGRLEVGTETIIDKSKSVKSVLMQLFEESGNTDVEGVDTKNACYGGTAALFNAVAWIESSAYDGRLALVVAADIAVYAEGSARPTGGAGAIAMLVGPNAALIFDAGVRSSFMKHAYDFYKPNLSSEYPTVDGKLSVQCYLTALDHCYQLYCSKAKQKNTMNSSEGVQLKHFYGVIFHAPYCKLVQKSLARLAFNDFKNTPAEELCVQYQGLEKFKDLKLEDTYFDREVEKAFMDFSKEIFEQKTKPSLLLANQVGNMYTPSLYGGLVSLLINDSAINIAGKRIGLFSYGSGIASSFYSVRVSKNFEEGSPLNLLISGLSYVKQMLSDRIAVSPDIFSQIMKIREKSHHEVPYLPVISPNVLFSGTWYLEKIDDMYRRTYKRTSKQQKPQAPVF